MPMELTFLHTNDFHGRLDEARVARLRQLREQENAVYFDSGDCVKSGNLAIPVRQEKCWELLAQAGCAASVPGNRESHPMAMAFKAKLHGATHPVLCANLWDKSGGLNLPPSLEIQHCGVRIGVVAAMVPMVTERMKASLAASSYLWTAPIPAIQEHAKLLRPRCDVLVALTHIGYKQDLALAEACPELDLILGGHSHTVLEAPTRVGNTWVCQGGSHGRYVGVYRWAKGAGLVDARLEALAAA